MSNIILKRSEYIIFGLLLFLCIALRVWFWYATDLTLEDALITFRYAENIADGNGFVYNTGERVLGTTTPAWTLLLSGTKYLGMNLFYASKALAILLDAITCILIILILLPFGVRTTFISALLFATSPAVISISISGMETSLLLCAMSLLLLGYVRKNLLFGFGLALTILTRIDGVLYASVFALAAILQNRKWAVRQLILACLYCAPWYIFSLTYFGNILPQSFLAKRGVYHLSFMTSAEPFINAFTPFLDAQLLKIIVKLGMFVLLVIGMVLLFRRKSVFLPAGIFILLYCAIFMTSGTIIFGWYLIPPIFISYFILAAAVDWCISKTQKSVSKPILQKVIIPAIIFSIFLLNTSLVHGRIEKYNQLQEFENEVRRPIGLWLKDNAEPDSKIFLEPLGYIGYFAGPKLIIWDEIGLVNPKVVEYRKSDGEWYTKSIKALRPDYIVQYAATLEHNRAEGTQTPIFANDADRSWFFSHFQAVKTVEALKIYPSIEDKEKKYIIFKRTDTSL